MRRPCRLLAPAVMLLVIGAVSAPPARAAASCTDLPPSILRIYDIKAPAVEAVEVQANDLDSDRQAGDLASRHALMLSGSDVIALFAITHRIVPRPDGSFCDAPSLVRVGFGSGRRIAFLARDAARDSCILHELLEHEASHTRAFNEAVDRFIERQKGILQRGLSALKQTPAASADRVKRNWDAGLRAIIAAARNELLGDIQAASAAIDEASAAAFDTACGGKIRLLQERSGQT